MPTDALNVLCAQLMRDLFAIAKFLLSLSQGINNIVKQHARCSVVCGITCMCVCVCVSVRVCLCVSDVQFIRRHRRPVTTFDEALRDVKHEMCLT